MESVIKKDWGRSVLIYKLLYASKKMGVSQPRSALHGSGPAFNESISSSTRATHLLYTPRRQGK